LWITVYNFVTVYGVLTKFNTTMCTYIVLLCTNFQDNRIMRLCFITTFVVWRKEEKKWRNSANIQRFISRKNLAQFSWNLECEVMRLADVSTEEISWLHWSVKELRIHENYIIFLPVNNSRLWHTSFLGHTTHYCVSWYIPIN